MQIQVGATCSMIAGKEAGPSLPGFINQRRGSSSLRWQLLHQPPCWQFFASATPWPANDPNGPDCEPHPEPSVINTCIFQGVGGGPQGRGAKSVQAVREDRTLALANLAQLLPGRRPIVRLPFWGDLISNSILAAASYRQGFNRQGDGVEGVQLTVGQTVGNLLSYVWSIFILFVQQLYIINGKRG